MIKKLNTTRIIPLILASLLIFCACGASVEETGKENISEGTYHFYKEMMPAETLLDIEEIRFPQTIKGFNVIVKRLITPNQYIVELETSINGDWITKEIGRYDLKKDNYETILELMENELYGIETFNDDYLVLTFTRDEWVNMSLCLIGFKDKNLIEIHKYHEDHSEMSKNSIIIDENRIYFDDLVLKEDQSDIRVFSYDILTNKKEIVRPYAQNPMKYGDEIYVITKNDAGKYRQLSPLNNKNEPVVDFGNNLKYLKAANDHIYSLNVNTDEKERLSKWYIEDVITHDKILESQEVIDRLTVGSDFVAWGNFIDDIPYVYDIKRNKILAFQGISAGCNSFMLFDGAGVVVNYSEDQTKYYRFNYKNPE